MRTAFIQTLHEIAAHDERVWLLTGDVGYSVIERFAGDFPNRFLNVGVAEQNMTGIAAGLALSEYAVFTYSIANFPILRCLEQIRNDVCYHNLNVNIVSIGGGFAYGSAGYSHHAIEDIAIMRSLPNIKVIAPGDPQEVRALLPQIVDDPAPSYLRLGKAGEAIVHQTPPDATIGQALWLQQADDLTLISTGGMLPTTIQVGERLANDYGLHASIISMHTIKPLDDAAVISASETTSHIVTLEEHSLRGGLGSSVAECLAKHNRQVPLQMFGITDSNLYACGSQNDLREMSGLDTPTLIHKIVEYHNALG